MFGDSIESVFRQIVMSRTTRPWPDSRVAFGGRCGFVPVGRQTGQEFSGARFGLFDA